MRTRVLFPLALPCICLFAACSASRSSAYLVISNDNDKDIPLTVLIHSPQNNTTAKTLITNIKPGIQELAPEKLPKGMYAVSAKTEDGIISAQKPLSLDSDRWIIISFTQSDSLAISRKYGYVDTSVLKKLHGKYTGIDLYSDSRRPPSLRS